MDYNIVFFGSVSFPNGFAMTKRWRHIIDKLDDNGISCHVIVLNWRKGNFFKNNVSGVYGKQCKYFDVSLACEGKKHKETLSLAQKKLLEAYDPTKKNILITHSVNLRTFATIRFAKNIGYAIVLDIVETSYLKSSTNRRLASKIFRYLSDAANRYVVKKYVKGVFVISTFLKEEIQNINNQIPIKILPNSTPVLNKQIKEKLHKPMKILYSGTYAEKDGVAYLIEGVIDAKQKGCDCELALLGKGADKDMAFLKGIDKYPFIKYYGFVSDEKLIEQMLDSDVLCMTRTNSVFSNYGFPFKLSEYLSTGNIVLASRVGDVPNYLEDLMDCYMVNPEDSVDISETLLYIQEHEKQSLQIAQNGLATMKKYFSKEEINNLFMSLINEI